MTTNATIVAHTRSTLCIMACLLFWFWLSPMTVNAQDNPIVIENRLPGASSWGLSQPANDVGMQIKGFASLTSVNKGQSIKFYIHVNSPQTYTIDIYRMGWYDGRGGRLMQSIGPRNGLPQPAPILNSATIGTITAPWSSSYTLQIPNSWTSGIYLAKLKNANGFDNYMTFVVTDDARSADFIYQQAITTSQAYNNFPDNGVLGKSLYDYNSHGSNTIGGDPRAVKVSFDRPYSGRGDGQFFYWDFDTVRWLEKEGYDVVYSTDLDLHENGASLLNYKGFIIAGHDEYWTSEMYDAAENARDAGVHLAFMGSDAVYWQSRFESNNRVLVVYKDASIDPITDPALKTVLFRDAGRAEQQLIGIQYESFNGNSNNNTDLIVTNSSHWLWRNTGFINGSRVPNITGYEVDNLHASFPGPSDNGTQVFLSNSPFVDQYGETVFGTTSVYQASSGAWVFASGTMSWAWALTRTNYTNAGIQQATKNVFARFLEDTDPANQLPTITSSGNQTDFVGETVTLQINANDLDGDTLTYSAVNLPIGLAVEPTTGIISGVPSTAQSRIVDIAVDDGNGGVASQNFTWTVSNALAPVIIRIDSVTIAETETLSIPIVMLPENSGETIGVVTLEINYDRSVVAINNCITSEFLGSCNINANTGTVKISGISSSGLDSETVVAIMDLQAVGASGSISSLDITVTTLANTAGQDITNYQIENSSVTITAGAVSLLGDVNCNGTVTSVDSLFVMQYEVDLRSDGGECPIADTQTELAAARGDVNLNGTTNVVDALMILQCVVDISNIFCPADGVIAADQLQDAVATGSAEIALVPNQSSLAMHLRTEDVRVGAGTIEMTFDSNRTQLIECVPAPNGYCHEVAPGHVIFNMVEPLGILEAQLLAELTFDSDDVEITDVRVTNLVSNSFQDVKFHIANETSQGLPQQQNKYRLFLPLLSGE